MSLLEQIESKDYDDRTLRQQLKDLGVEVVQTGAKPKSKPPPAAKVTDVKWAQRRKVTVPRKWKNVKPHVNIGRHHLYFNVSATRVLEPKGKRYQFGVCMIGGKKALILREGKRGFSITVCKRINSEFGQNCAPGLRRQLSEAGLDHGRYEIVAAKGYDGVWLGVPEE